MRMPATDATLDSTSRPQQTRGYMRPTPKTREPLSNHLSMVNHTSRPDLQKFEQGQTVHKGIVTTVEDIVFCVILVC